MTFEQLTYFVEAYQQKSITKASENLFVSRPVVSCAIKKLEEEFDTVLFTRFANRIEPTAAAQDLYQTAVTVLHDAVVLKQTMHKHAKSASLKNTYKINFSGILLNFCKNPFMTALQTMFPDYSFFASNKFFNPFSTQKNDFDITIFYSPTRDLEYCSSVFSSMYTVNSLLEIPCYVWISKDSPLNAYSIIKPELLKDFNQSILLQFTNSSFYANSFHLPIENTAIFENEQDFVNSVLLENCYAFDSPFIQKQFAFADYFKNQPVVLKETSETFSLKIIYKTATCADLYPSIANILYQLFA